MSSAALGRSEIQTLRELIDECYEQLRFKAKLKMNGERPNHSLQATELVSELYLRLENSKNLVLHNKYHFIAIAVTTMKRILLDHNRKRISKRRRLDLQVEFSSLVVPMVDWDEDRWLEYEFHMDELKKIKPRQAKVLEYSLFGYEEDEIATTINRTRKTVTEDLRQARAWFHEQFNKAE